MSIGVKRFVVAQLLSLPFFFLSFFLLSSELSFGGSRRLSSAQVSRAFSDLYASRPDILAELQNDPNIELDPRRDNFTQQYYAETCLGPTSFNIQLVTESTAYGLTSFLGDLGGALNILGLALGFLFPLTQTFIQPRTFILVWLTTRLRRCRRGVDNSTSGDESDAADADADAAEDEAQMRAVLKPNTTEMRHFDETLKQTFIKE